VLRRGEDPGAAAPALHHPTLPRRLATVAGGRVATGRDFNDDGQLRPAALKASTVHLHQAGATAAGGGIYGLRAADLENIDAGGWFGPGVARERASRGVADEPHQIVVVSITARGLVVGAEVESGADDDGVPARQGQGGPGQGPGVGDQDDADAHGATAPPMPP